MTERSVRAILKRWKRFDLRLYRMWEYFHARSVLRCTSGSESTSGSEICDRKRLFAAAQVALDKFLVKSAAEQADERAAAMPPFLLVSVRVIAIAVDRN